MDELPQLVENDKVLQYHFPLSKQKPGNAIVKKIIAGNWKMHGNAAMAQALPAAIAALDTPYAEIVLFPPFPYLTAVKSGLEGSSVRVGAQDCHVEDEGAHTGEVSALMLKDIGCSHVIIGHSERRAEGETSAEVQLKASSAVSAGLVPVICVGESESEREAGQAMGVVQRQIEESLPATVDKTQILLAYEPVWAIGTGRTATLDDIITMHQHIQQVAPGIAILYGGSVKPGNATEILLLPEASGVLVGGASLKAADFCAIVEAAAPEHDTFIQVEAT